jgi:hypothetical protein
LGVTVSTTGSNKNAVQNGLACGGTRMYPEIETQYQVVSLNQMLFTSVCQLPDGINFSL